MCVSVCVCVCVCVCVRAGARLTSTEQQLLFPSKNVQANPNRPALDGNNSRSLDRIARRAPQTSPHENFRPVCRHSPSRVACRQTERPSGLFVEEAFQRSHLQGTEKNDRMMNRQHAIMFPLSGQSPTLQKNLLPLARNPQQVLKEHEPPVARAKARKTPAGDEAFRPARM